MFNPIIMVSYNINEFYSGLKIIQDDEPCLIIHHEFINPGKGQAFNRVRFRKLISGKIIEKIFKSGDTADGADVIDLSLVYLYTDNQYWYFMNKKNFEQFIIDRKTIGENTKWLTEQTEYTLTLWNKSPISITLPKFVELEIITTDPNIKSDSINNGNKLAILKTGAIVKVPLFIKVGEFIKIDTRSGEYVSRAK